MHIVFEISRPFAKQPGFYRCPGVTAWRIWWLWFAVSCHPMRQDELLSGGYAWTKDA